MKRFFHRMAAVCRKTWVWSLLLLIALAALIWWLGPLLAVADHRFWESATSRLLSIAVLCLAWGLFIVLHGGLTARRAQREVADPALQEQRLEETRLHKEQAVLLQRHQQAQQVLRSATLYAGRSERWRGKLPWYLLIGADGSGKTSLLDFSGLEFPLNSDEQRRLTRDIRGTSHADWYFAEQAVVIDTAGRYLTQGDAKVDGSGWQTLLGLLKRRRTRPLNGVLVTLAVEDLQDAAELKLATLARQTRQRLEELRQRLAVEVPVYLVLTKADRIVGFDAFFDQLSREESDQVLGTSFGKSQNGTDPKVLRQAFEELLRRLNSQVISRIHQERETQRRGRILDFPHQLAQIGEALCLFVELAFAGNRYQRASQLRGFYLTSAPRLETGLDNLTSEIGRNLQLDGANLPRLRQGRARFIHHLLSRVVFPESRLACLDDGERRRLHWGQRSLYAGALACLLLLAGVWTQSFSSNHSRLLQVRALADQRVQARAPLTPTDDARQLLETLDRAFAATSVFPAPDQAQLFDRAGLYQGEAVSAAVERAYRQDLERLLLPRVARQLEAQIRASQDNREQLLGSLRAYLMLEDSEHRDADFLRQWLAADWAARYPGDTPAQIGLAAHFDRLLEGPFAHSTSAQVVSRARQLLRSESLATVVYRLLRDEARSLPAYRLGEHLGPQGHVLLNTDKAIPGFYTEDGYRRFYLARGADAVRSMLRDNWVLGRDSGVSAADLRQLMADMERLYFQDYAQHWGGLVDTLRVNDLTALQEGSQQLAGLGGANSPIISLLAELRRHTRFKGLAAAADEAADLAQTAADGRLGTPGHRVATLAEAARSSLEATLPDGARKALERRFHSLHQLLDEDGAPTAELAAALQAIDQLQQQLAGLARASDPEVSAFELARARMAGERSAIDGLRQQATRLPQPLFGWMNALASDSWRTVLGAAHGHLNHRYRQELYAPYRDSLHKRYPFHAQSESDVALADFRDFFSESGHAERFIGRYLQPFLVRTGDNYRVRQLDGQGMPFSSQFLTQLQRAHAIRLAFFAENPAEPEIRFVLEPYSLDPNLGRAEFSFAGTRLEYRHGPITATSFQWPAPDNDSRTRLVLEEIGGKRIGLERDAGPWTLFRVMELMELDRHHGRDVLLMKVNFGGRRVNYLVHTPRRVNPFDLAQVRRFNLPAAL